MSPTATINLPTAQALEAALRVELNPSFLLVEDESWKHAGHAGVNEQGVGTHFRLRIASPQFVGQNRVACHRLVYGALADFLPPARTPGIHALAIDILEENTP